MKRRTLLGTVAGAGIAATAGWTSQAQEGPRETPQEREGSSESSFELVDPEIAAEDPPVVDVDDGTVTVRGTVMYASSQCGTVRLVHEGYERSQNQLNLLVVAADESDDDVCTDDIAADGYRIELEAPEQLRYVAVTEHHVFGEIESTIVDVLGAPSEAEVVDDGDTEGSR